MDELVALGVPVIEDAAQAFGAPGVAQQGIASTYSFFPTKNLFCLGDGGLVATNDDELAERVQMLAFHGSRDKTDFDFVGYNSRLDELQAGMLRIFLGQLDELEPRAPRGGRALRRARPRRARRAAAGRARPHLPPVRLPLARARPHPRRADRGGIGSRDVLHDAAAPAACAPLPRQRARLAAGDRAASREENFSVPLWPGMPVEAQERVVEVVRSAVGVGARA